MIVTEVWKVTVGQPNYYHWNFCTLSFFSFDLNLSCCCINIFNIPDWLHWGVCNGKSSSEFLLNAGGLKPLNFPELDPPKLPRSPWSRIFLFLLATSCWVPGIWCWLKCIALKKEKRSESPWLFPWTSIIEGAPKNSKVNIYNENYRRQNS